MRKMYFLIVLLLSSITGLCPLNAVHATISVGTAYVNGHMLATFDECQPPAYLEVSDVMGTSAFVTWQRNNDFIGSYELSYKMTGSNEWIVVTDLQTEYYLLTGLQPQTVYNVRLRAVCAGTTSDYVEKSFTTGCRASETATIGEGNASNYGAMLPFFNYNNYYACSQQIYTAAELGGARIISNISLQYFYGTPITRNLTIYLGHTAKSSFASTTDWEVSDSLTQVFSGEITFNNNSEWFTIALSTPFSYNGTDNLIIAFDDNTGADGVSAEKFFTSYCGVNRALYAYGVSNYDFSTISSINSDANFYQVNRSGYRNNIRFETCLDNACGTSNVVVVEPTDSSAKVLLVVPENAGQEVQYRKTGDNMYTALPTYNDVFTLTDLNQNTEYEVRVRTVCANGISSWKSFTFTTGVKNLERLYVTTTGTGDGSSWSEATDDLNWALRTAFEIRNTYGVNPEVWVAEGSCYSSGDGTTAFTMYNGIKLYGGFASGETSKEQRNLTAHSTVLDGHKDRRVMECLFVRDSIETVIDGFTFQNGVSTNGGALYLYEKVYVRNCKFSDNLAGRGGAVAYAGVQHQFEGYDFQNCEFVGNRSTTYGGAVNGYASLDFADCLFANNQSDSYVGAVNIARNFTNCLIANNKATYYSGGLYDIRGVLLNCDVVGNTISSTGVAGISAPSTSSFTLINSVVWGNKMGDESSNLPAGIVAVRSAIEGGYDGGEEIIALENDNFGTQDGKHYPFFVAPEYGDYRLRAGSALIDAGSNSYVRGTSDLAGESRLYGDSIDMGCYEYHGETYCAAPCSIVVADIVSSSAMVTWENGNPEAAYKYELSYKAVDSANWTVIDNIHDDYYMISGLQPHTDYLVRMCAWCDAGTVSGYSSEKAFTTKCLSESSGIIGQGTSTIGYLPTHIYYKYSYSQQIYLAEEIGGPVTIDNIALQYTGSSQRRYVSIYLGHTNKSSFSSTSDWVPYSNLTPVFTGYITFNTTGTTDWQTIPLTTAFEYNGTDNLVFAFDDNTGSDVTGNNFYVHTTPVARALYYNNDYTNYSPSSPGNAKGYTTYRNNLRIPPMCINSGCDRSNLVVRDITDSSALLVFVPGAGSSDYDLEYRKMSEDSYTPIQVAGSPYTLTGLTQNTQYEARIRSHCGADSSVWKSVTFTTGAKRYDRLYVKAGGTGEGSSWSDAANDLNWAVSTAATIGQQFGVTPDVWVAQGVYYGDVHADNAFTMAEGVNVYGGFEGNEDDNYDLALRDFDLHVTILDGQNSRRVLQQPQAFTTQTVWDGFTIQNGNPSAYGGGAYLYAGSGLNHCKLMNNKGIWGGGVYATGSETNPVLIDHCTFTHDTATSYGGGLYAIYAQIRNSSFTNNQANYGGGIYYTYSVPGVQISNCLVADNTSLYSGGGIYKTQDNLTIEQTTVANNHANSSAGDIYRSNTSVSINLKNCVLWGNTTGSNSTDYLSYSYENCAVEGGISGNDGVINLSNENIGTDNGQHYPMFASPEDGDYRLREGSALINAGGATTTTSASDLANLARVYGDTIDLGCYEYHGETYCTAPINIVVNNITGSSALITWRNSNSEAPLSYELQYKAADSTEWHTVTGLQHEYHLLGGLQQQTAYQVRLRTFCDDSLSSYATAMFSTECLGGYTDAIVIESGSTNTSVSYLPTHAYYKYSYTQQIYRADMLGGEKDINQMAVQYFYTTTVSRTIDIYLGHTDKNSFSSNSDWVPLSDLTMVYSGSLTFNNSGEDYWFTIPFDTTFAYNGTDNLVVVFDDNTGSWGTNAARFYLHSSLPNSSIAYYNDNTNCNPASPQSASSRTNYRMNIRLPGQCISEGCDRANLTIGDVTDSSVLILYTPGVGTVSTELEYKMEGDDQYTSLPVGDGSHLLTGLRPFTRGEVRIRSICDQDQYSNWMSQSFTTAVRSLNRLYVREGFHGDGSSWENATGNLVRALNYAAYERQSSGITPDIWVAQGTYYGDSISNNAFTLVEGVHMYGGFVGNEPDNYDLSLRDPDAHPTILDGQNSQRVVYQPADFNTRTIIDGFTIQHGWASSGNDNGDGGGIYLREMSTLHKCKVVNNASAYRGCGLFAFGNSDGRIQIDSCVISGNYYHLNSTNNYGGGIYIRYSNAEHLTVTNNTGYYAGGLYAIYSTVGHSTITHNTGYSGGGVYASHSTIENCTVEYNSSSFGGGVNGYYSLIKRCIISHNTSSSNGGGVYLDYADGTNGLYNCLIANNTSSTTGGGVYAYRSYSNIVGNTVVNNWASSNAGGIHNQNTSNYLYNNIVWGNRKGSNQVVDNVPYYSVSYFRYNAVENCPTDADNTNIILQSENIGVGDGLYYPFFVSPEYDDYRLRSQSPMINAGWNIKNEDSTDLADLVRVYDNTIDMGCYEYHGEIYCLSPMALTVENVTGNSAVITWQSSSIEDAVQYELSYKIANVNDWIVAGQVADNYYLLTGLEPQKSYMVRVRAVCGENSSSAYTDAVTFSTVCSGNYVADVHIGETDETTNGTVIPFNSNARYSYCQQLYLASEIGNARPIDTLYLQYYNNYFSENRTLDVYLGHTSRSTFATDNSYVPVSELQLVFSGSLTLNTTVEYDWLAIPLNRGVFEYNGVDNLVLAVNDKTGSTSSSDCGFYTHVTPDARTLNSYRSSTSSAVINPASLVTGGKLTYVNNLWLPGLCEAADCGRVNVVVRDVTDTSALVVFAAGNGAVDMQMEYHVYGQDNYTVLPTQSSPYLLTGLLPNTLYEVRARSICSGQDSSVWQMKTFKTNLAYLDRLYVREGSQGNGSSWADATNDLAWALNYAASIKEKYGMAPDIWVAQGTYYGDGTSDNAFTMVQGVNVYGGFAGDESDDYDLSLRDVTAHPSILDGQNSQRVLYQPTSFTQRTVWDGFTLQHGKAAYENSSGQIGGGAYLRGNSSLIHCRVVDNWAYSSGGGVYAGGVSTSTNTLSTSCVIIDHCTIENNNSYSSLGGGVYLYYSQLKNSTVSHNGAYSDGGGVCMYYGLVQSCSITHNRSNSYGGGINVTYLSSTDTCQGIINCLIANDTAMVGGGIYVNSRLRMENSTVVNNYATSICGGVYFSSTQSFNIVNNSVIWGNTNIGYASNVENNATFQYSAVESLTNDFTGVKILQHDNMGSEQGLYYPFFVAPNSGDYRLRAGSSLINAGMNTDNMPATDLAGGVRVYDNTVDIGCYEFHNEEYCMEPASLALQDVMGSSAMLTWANSNLNEPLYYELSYKKADDVAWTTVGEQIHDNSYLLTGLSPQTSYMARLRAICDTGQVSEYSDALTFTTNCSGGYAPELILGTSNGTSNADRLPIYGTATQSYSQQLYQASELGGARTIDVIYLQYYNSSRAHRIVDIYLGHTSKSSFSDNTFVPGSALQLVFSGDIVFNETGGDNWFSIPLDTFEYNGIDNLVLVFNDKTGDTGIPQATAFYTHNASERRGLYVYNNNNGDDFDPYTVTTGTTSYYVNNLRLPGYCDMGCDRANLFVQEVTDSSALLLAVPGEGATSLDMMYSVVGTYANPVWVQADSGYNWLRGLHQNTQYEVSVRSVCSGDSASAWKRVRFTTPPKHLSRIYVSNRGMGDGSSWEDATRNLDWAMSTAQQIYQTYGTMPEIWVAEGSYSSTSSTSGADFILEAGMKLYGGFVRGDTSIEARNINAHPTVLYGYNNNRLLYQNSYNDSMTVVLDGFTIRHGNINGQGGGAYLKRNFEVRNCRFVDNTSTSSGGAVYIEEVYGYDDGDRYNRYCFRNCEFTGNTSSNSDGGAVYDYKDYASYINCRFTGNNAGGSGGALYGGRKLVNCEISDNTARFCSGAYSISDTLINCDIVGNTSRYTNSGGSYYTRYYAGLDYFSGVMINTVVWGNISDDTVCNIANYGSDLTLIHCAIEGGLEGDTTVINLAHDNLGTESGLHYPMFASPYSGDYRLQEGSSLIDMGLNTVEMAEKDLAGETRVHNNGTIDIGCYEYHGEVYCSVPYSLAANNITGTSAVISWQSGNPATSDHYILAYRKEGESTWTEVPQLIYDNSFVITGLQQQTTYQACVLAVCTLEVPPATNTQPGDSTPIWIFPQYDVTSSEYSAPVTFTTVCSGEYAEEVTVGNGYNASNSSANYYPVYAGGYRSYTQQIYLSDEIGGWRMLDTLYLRRYSSTEFSRNLDVYMGHTRKNEFSNNSDWVPFNELTLVYSGNLNFPNAGDGEWFAIPLTAFEYNGIDNLVIAFHDHTGARSNLSSYYTCYTYYTSGSRSLYSYRYNNFNASSEYDLLHPDDGTRTDYNNVIRFPGKCVQGTCDAPGLTVQDVTDSSASVLVTGIVEGDTTELEYRDTDNAGNETYNSLPAPLSSNMPVQLYALSPDTRYEVRARVWCGNGSSEWRHVYFRTPAKDINRLYVTPNGTGDGTSWAKAAHDISAMQNLALSVRAQFGHTPDIWVAQGTYYGDTTAVSDNAFTMVEGVNVYGGFEGVEPENYDLSLRDFENHASILDGRNNRRVLNQPSHFTTRTTWDGFTIQNGNANTSNSSENNGGGVYLKNGSTLSHCQITHCTGTGYGKAVYVEGDNSYYSNYDTTYLQNCTISHNSAIGSSYNGKGVVYLYKKVVMDSCVVENNKEVYAYTVYVDNGAIRNSTVRYNSVLYYSGSTMSCVSATNAVVSACDISYNEANSTGGLSASNTLVDNCLIANNTGGSSSGYGGVYAGTSVVIKNSTIVNNVSYSPQGAGIYAGSYGSAIINCIVWGNKNSSDGISSIYMGDGYLTVSRTAADEVLEGDYNILLSPANEGSSALQGPEFVRPSHTAGSDDTTARVDWHLNRSSTLVNRGDNSVATVYDIEGNDRVQMSTIDLGCYESPYMGTYVFPTTYDSIIYVVEGGAGARTGDSWENALPTIQEALLLATLYHAQVWVARGSYYGDSVSGSAFYMAPGIRVYGGFAGVETSIAQRVIEDNPTILDGDYRQRVLMQDRNYTAETAAIWDGFIIQNGQTLGNGAGVYMRAYSTIRNCTVRYNVIASETPNNTTSYYGAGVYASNNYNCIISHCKVEYNTYVNAERVTGGGVSGGRIDHSEISHNTAYSHGGISGGYVTNSLIYDNKAETIYTNYGNSSYNASGVGDGTYINCDIVQNRGGASNNHGTMINCIIWGNGGNYMGNYSNGSVSYSYCAIQKDRENSNYTGEGNITLESDNDGYASDRNYVRFIDPAADDFRLHITSNCVNVGSNAALDSTDTLDLLGNPRVKNQVVDMGCYEMQEENSCPPVLNLHVDNVSATWVDLNWHPTGSESQWLLRYHRVAYGSPEELVTVNVNDVTQDTAGNVTYRLNGLTSFRSYTADLRAVCGDSINSVYSLPVTFTTICDTAAFDNMPDFTSMTVLNADDYEYVKYVYRIPGLDLAWSAIEHATSYDVYLWNATDPEPTTPRYTVTTPTISSAYPLPKRYAYSYYDFFGDYYETDNYWQSFQFGESYCWKVVAWNNCVSKSSPVDTFTLPKQCDLHVTQITNSAARVSQPMTVNYTVKNDGGGRTPNGMVWTEYIWITSNGDIRWEEQGLGGLYLLAQVPCLGQLYPGDSANREVTVTIPSDIESGTYYLYVLADQMDAFYHDFSQCPDSAAPNPYQPSVTGNPYPYVKAFSHYGGILPEAGKYEFEMAEGMIRFGVNDNFFYKVLEVMPPPAPDLVVTAVNHSGNANSGDRTTITWTVENTGSSVARDTSWIDAIYISEDTILDQFNDLLLGRYVHENGLGAGENYQNSAEVTIPVDYMGDYYIFVVTDHAQTVYENIYEGNNTGISAPLTVILTRHTDLVASNVSLSSNVVDANGDLSCHFTVTNNGATPTYENRWVDAVYISRDSVYSRLTAFRLAAVTHNGVLNGEDHYDVEVNMHIPDTISGKRYLFVIADAQNDVFEHSVGLLNTAEDNNVFTYSPALDVRVPDLYVSSITLPDVVKPLVLTPVRWVVRNNGPGNLINRSFTDRFVVENEVVYEADVRNVSIPAGDSLVRTALIRIPCVSPAALTIFTDDNLRVMEANELNNYTTKQLNLHASTLRVSDLSVVRNASAVNDPLWSGTTANLSYTVTNIGLVEVESDTIVDKIYFSRYADSYSASDSVGVNIHPIYLERGSSESYVCPVTIPNGVSGNYYFHVVCNATDIICMPVRPSMSSDPLDVQVSPSPDLVVTDVSAPAQIYLGANFELNYTIANQGTAAVHHNVVQKFYYSNSRTTYDTLNQFAMVNEHLDLEVNASVTNTLVGALPVNITSGNYFIHVVTDATDQIYEHEAEDNNRGVSSSVMALVYPLDLQLTLEAPDVLRWGETVICTLHIRNNSDVPSFVPRWPRWEDVVYLSYDPIRSNDDLQLASEQRDSVLAAGATYTVQLPITVPYGADTTVAYLIGVTDKDHANPDINRDNNQFIKEVRIKPTSTPDLAVSNVVVLDEVVCGQATRIAYTVTNVSTELDISQQSWVDRVFVSGDSTLRNTAVLLQNVGRTNMTLGMQESYRDTITFAVPMAFNGNLYLLMEANGNNIMFEANRENNMVAVPVNVTLPLPGDLVVTEVSCANSVVSGQQLNARWTIKNIGNNALRGNGLRSLAYISADTVFDVNDRLLGGVTSNGINMGVDATMQQNVTGRISGLAPGEYYIIVKIDVTNAFHEVNDQNNTGYLLDPFTVTIRPLPFNTDVFDTVRNSEVSDYQLTVGENKGQTVRVHLASEDSLDGAVNMIYITHNGMGDNLNYNFSTIGQYTANAELYIPSTLPGYYGVNIYGSTPVGVSQNMIVRADILPFELRAVNADHGGNTGKVTVELTGSRFRPDMAVCLRHGNEEICADTLIYVNYYKAFARFNLTGHTPGVYDVSAVNLCEGESVLYNGFTIVNGQPSEVGFNLLFPSAPRPNRNIVMMLEFGNTGNVDLHDQVLEITSIGGCPISLTSEGVGQNNTTIRLPLTIDGEPAGLLRPGSYGVLNIFTYSSNALIFSIKPVK
ncbi:MAG: fibronectin type III domain-containing protein [Bacteroidales bacterium]|nr:fibronectin type III domain-containing protein [Bacteroidales bacterium]